MQYIYEWGHLYLMHFGAWISFAIGASVIKDGIPKLEDIPMMLLSSAVLGSIVAIFSSHAHHVGQFLGK